MRAVFLAATLVLFCANSVAAHRLNVFAWLENGKVVVECNFGKSSPARDAEVSARELDGGRELARGRTDKEGRFEFPAPRGIGLLITANAGEGHQNQWKMPASDFTESSPTQAAAPQPAGEAETAADEDSPLTATQARSIVNTALEKELGPIHRMLAEMQSSAPTLRDIIGGIGWIIGLVGIFLYFKARK